MEQEIIKEEIKEIKMKSSDFDVAKIIKLYTKDLKSSYEIAEECSTYPNMIVRTLKKYGIKLRSRGEAQTVALNSGKSSHPTLGTKRSEATKLKISKKTRNNWKGLDETEKERRIQIAKDRWALMTDEQKTEMCSAAAKAVRLAAKEGSKLEKLILESLTKLYEVHHHRHIIPNDKMEVDLYIPELKTAIEIDGPSHFLPIWGEDKLKQIIKSDGEKNGHIIGNGFFLIRIKCKANNITLSGVDELINKLTKILSDVQIQFPVNVVERLVEIDFE